MSVQILIGDVREKLKGLPDESVHCVVTSPPYWGLRDYGVDGQLGLEPTLGEHIATMADLFDEVRRVLRKDGTLWLNYGDSYAASVNGRSAADTKALGEDDRTFRDKPFSTVGPIHGDTRSGFNARYFGKDMPRGKQGEAFDHLPNVQRGGGILKPKDLCGVPWRIAFALQERGWWLRQDIIWHKPNPMPESIKDRCTKAHEYIFLLSKSARYYFDAEAISEATSGEVSRPSFRGGCYINNDGGSKSTDLGNVLNANNSRNRRSVWTIATAPFSEAHFATFPPELPELCIKAGSKSGDTILDPFGGAGTTGMVADRLQRHAILIELNTEYAAMAERRIANDRGGLLELMEAAE